MDIKRIIVLLLISIAFFSFISCDNVKYNGGEVSIEEIITNNDSSTSSNNKNVSIKSSINASRYLLRMIPVDYNPGAVIFGDTRTSSTVVNDMVYDSFKEILPDKLSNIGYVSQGSWLVSIIALDINDNVAYVFGGKSGDNPDYSYPDYNFGEKVYINSSSTKITVDLEEAVGSGESGIITMNDYKFGLVSSMDMYSQEGKNGFRIRVIVDSLDNTSGTQTIETVVGSENVSYLRNKDGSINSSVGVLNNLEIARNIPNGVYSLKVIMDEFCDGSWVQAAGVTYSFKAIRGANRVISTDKNASELDLVPFDYVTPGGGTGGVIIDSGINSVITITSKVEGNAVENNTVTNGTTVTFTASVTQNGVPISDISNHIWMVNGDIQSGFDTNVFSYQFTENKTYTITYMFTDSTSYNTISKNEYIKVTAASSTN